MADYVEEREFTLRLELRCKFPESYEGEEDGYAWAESMGPLTQAVVAAAIQTIKSQSTWTVRAGNRGRSSEDEVTLVLERTAT